MTRSFHDHVNEFLDATERDMLRRGDTNICFPCYSFQNLTLFERKSSPLHMHLMHWGFMEGHEGGQVTGRRLIFLPMTKG
jgi:hypothetical protein